MKQAQIEWNDSDNDKPEDGVVGLLADESEQGVALRLVVFRRPGLSEPGKYQEEYICYHQDGNYHELPPRYCWVGVTDSIQEAKEILDSSPELPSEESD